MGEARFRVVFSGSARAGLSIEQVKEQLAAMYRLPKAKLDPYFIGGPVVVRRGLSVEEAKKTHHAFTSAGAMVRIEPETQTGLSRSVEDSAAAPSDGHPVDVPPTTQRIRTTQCPKCGLTQPESESCMNCGVIFSRAHTDPAPPGQAQPGPEDSPTASVGNADSTPHLFVDTIEFVPLLITSVTMGILNLLLVGVVLSPRMGWDFLARHINVNGEKLTNSDLWLGLRPMLWIPVCLVVLFVLAWPLGVALFGLGAISEALAEDVGRLLGFPLLALVAAPLQLGVLHSLILTTTTTSGQPAFRQLFPANPAGFWSFIRHRRRSYWMAGGAFMAFLFFFTTPVGFAIMMTLLFNQLEIDGHRYSIAMPWKKSFIWSALCVPTVGIASLFFVLWYFNQHLPSGRWHRPSVEPQGRVTAKR